MVPPSAASADKSTPAAKVTEIFACALGRKASLPHEVEKTERERESSCSGKFKKTEAIVIERKRFYIFWGGSGGGNSAAISLARDDKYLIFEGIGPLKLVLVW